MPAGDHKGRPYNKNIKTLLWATKCPVSVGAALVAARISGHFLIFLIAIGTAIKQAHLFICLGFVVVDSLGASGVSAGQRQQVHKLILPIQCSFSDTNF
jgi:hypothetical protein